MQLQKHVTTTLNQMCMCRATNAPTNEFSEKNALFFEAFPYIDIFVFLPLKSNPKLIMRYILSVRTQQLADAVFTDISQYATR